MNKILFIRGKRVLLDSDLAMLYGVSTKNLNKAVGRNNKRFPEDFMFQLTGKEFSDLKFQIGTSSWGGRRKLPFVFTQEGVAMLSGILKSERAIKVNIIIMRAFVQINRVLHSNVRLSQKIREIENRLNAIEGKQQRELKEIYDLIKQLITQEESPEELIGFNVGN